MDSKLIKLLSNLRWLACMLMLLLTPVAMLAEDYGLTVAGVQVTSNNATSGITGDNITGTVTFAAGSKTLTLNGATINGNIVSSLTGDLTVHLVGTNTINAGQGAQAFMSTTSSSLTFTAAEGGLLRTNIPRTNGNAVIASGFSFSDKDDVPEGYMLSWDADGNCSLGKYYGLYLNTFVNGNSYFQAYYVTAANCDRLMGKYIESNDSWDNSVITISYDDSEKTLTLNGASPEIASTYGTTHLINCYGENVENITIMLRGENTLRQYAGEVGGAGLIHNNLNEGTVTFTTDPETPGLLIMPGIESYYEYSYVVEADNVIYENGLSYVKDKNNVRYIKTLPSLGLTVAGVTVNEGNAGNVLNTVDEETELPTVVFDADNNKLTLNNASIEVDGKDAIVSSLENLTVFLVGKNYITCSGNSDIAFNKTSAVNNANITFATDATSNGSLTIAANQGNLFGTGVTPAYTNLSLKEDEGDYKIIDKRCGISVAGVEVTFFNKEDVLGDGTVSYNSTTHTLTLNDATINGGIESALTSGFNIHLTGVNTINASANIASGYIVNSTPDDWQSITFTADEGAMLLTNVTDVEFFFSEYDEGSAYIPTLPDDYAMSYDMNGMYHIAKAYNIYLQSMVNDNWGQQYITAANSNKILGTNEQATVTYNATENVLTLNNMNEVGPTSDETTYFINVDGSLTINLIGNNILRNNSDVGISFASGSNIIFTTDEENPGSLTITGIDTDYDYGEDFMFNANVTYQNGLAYSNDGEGNHFVKVASTGYGITVGGVVVTTTNAANVLGDDYRSVSYDAESNTLTLKGAQIMPSSEDAIVISKDVKALTVHLVGYNKIGSSDHYAFNLKGNTALTFTTSETMPGTICTYGQVLYSEQLALATYQNGLALNTENNEMKVEAGVKNIIYLTGFVSYVNSDNEGGAYMYTNGTSDFQATEAKLKEDAYVLVSTPEGSTQTEMWPVSIDASALKEFTFQFDWGLCTNKNVTVQVIGYNQNQQTYDYEADGKTYSSVISLSTADANGIVEIPLTSSVTSEQVRLKFSSTEAFSFVPLVIKAKLALARPYMFTDNEDDRKAFGFEYDNEMTQVYYSIDYVDENLEDVDNALYEDESVLLSGPCTVTAYAQDVESGEKSPNVVGKLFAFDTKDLRVSVDGSGEELPVEMPALVPAIEETDGIIVRYMVDNETLATIDDDQMTISGKLGWTTLSAVMIEDSEPTITVLNGDELGSASLAVVPQAPVVLPEDGCYSETQTVIVTSAYAEQKPDSSLIYTKKNDENAQLYSTSAQPTISESTVLKAWVIGYTAEGATISSDTVMVNYTILQSPELHFWTSEYSYIGTGNSYGTLDYYELESFTSPTLKAKIDGNYTSELADFGITYSSSDNAIATIDATGKITFAGGAGVVTIKAVSQETDVYAADSTWFTITLRPSDPQASIESGAYFVGQKVTMIPTVSNGEMYYKIGWDGEKVKYTEPITLPKGITEISFYTLCSTKDGEMWSYGNNHPTYYVYDKLIFTPDSETVSNDDIMVEIGNLPEANDYYPATVYYYFDDDEDNAKEYSSTTKVTVSESSTLKTFIEVRGDSGNVYRSEPVEAEYTVLPKTELNISYAQNSREWTSYCAEADLKTPEGLQAYVVSGITEDGVSVSEISYVPQGEGILLKRIAENVTEPIMAKAYMNDGPQQEMPVNWLLGTAASKTISTGSSDIFVLYNDGFTRAYKGSIPAHRAYLVITQSAPVSSRLSIFEDGETTSVIENREWRMENSGTSWYTLDGRKLQAEPTKAGVYIQKGQKKVVK